MAKIELDLTEENEIGFQLKIEGSDKDMASTKPNIRFVVTEEDTGKGWVFSTEKTDNGVSVVVPSMKGLISESNKYSGKLEVILGGRYFTPTEVELDFIEPLKVEAAVAVTTTRKSSKILEEAVEPEKTDEDFSIESEINSVIVKEDKKPKAPVVQPKPKAKTYAELNESDKKKVNSLFMKKCAGYGIDASDVSLHLKEGTDLTKKKLKALFAQSAKEYLEKINS